MKRALLLVMAVTMLAGTWQASQAQTSKSTTQKKNATAKATKPAETLRGRPTAAPVETATATEPVADSAPVVDSTTPDTAHHKKKGLFGKAKGVMSNKIVKAVVEDRRLHHGAGRAGHRRSESTQRRARARVRRPKVPLAPQPGPAACRAWGGWEALE